MAKTGPTCQVCRHQKRHQIEIALVHRVPLRVIAARFNVSRDAVHRHKTNHLSPQLAAAILTAQRPSEIDLEALQRTESEGLLASLVHQRARLQQHSELALELGDVKAATGVERAICSNLELVSRLLGQLVTRHEVRHSSVLLSPDYLRLRSVLIEALHPYPDAARAVGAALHALEAGAATDITESKRPLTIEGKAQ